ncbi:MAG: Rieske 2Fe-2S domain-containing protein [Gammaproteobacteria bacterium]|nr:Rieske 2Fe-2S domain-containing protein [Gammaproteobacteria bacterium]
MAFMRACSRFDVEPDRPFQFEWDGDPIAIVALDDEYFAIDDTCTHDRFSLCDGYIEGDEIVCPLHLARFAIRTGEVRMAPAYEPLQTYPLKLEGDDIYIDPQAHDE